MTKTYQVSEGIRNQPQLETKLAEMMPEAYSPRNVLVILPQELSNVPKRRNFTVLAPSNIGVDNLLELYRAGAKNVLIPDFKPTL